MHENDFQDIHKKDRDFSFKQENRKFWGTEILINLDL